MRQLAISVLCLSALCACSTPTETVPDVSLAIDQVARTADGRFLGFQYTITNASSDSVWIPACGGVIRPDVGVRVGGRVTDTYSGSVCQANVYMGPASIAPGVSYRGESSVQIASGATFVPSVTVSLSRSLSGPARRVSGTAFGAF